MHIPDGFCSLSVCVGTAVLSAGALGLSLYKTGKESSSSKTGSLMPATAAGVVFAAQMLNFPIGAGTSGHFLGALAVAALLGPFRAFLVMLAVLAVQAFAFADGGIMALGANVFNMGVIGGFVGYGILRAVYRFMPRNRGGYLAAVGVAAWSSVILASMACSVELALSGTFQFGASIAAMAGTHALIGIGEGLISCAIVGIVAYSRPDLLPDWTELDRISTSQKPAAVWPVAMIGTGLAFLMAAVLSPFASSSPDGLEKVAEDMGVMDRISELWTMSPLPDYSVNAISNPGFSTAAAGVIGVIMVFALYYLLSRTFGFRAGS